MMEIISHTIKKGGSRALLPTTREWTPYRSSNLGGRAFALKIFYE